MFSLQVVGVYRSSSGCGFHHCTSWSSSTGSWVATATREGRVEVVRVCGLGGGGGGGEKEEKNSLIQSKNHSLHSFQHVKQF